MIISFRDKKSHARVFSQIFTHQYSKNKIRQRDGGRREAVNSEHEENKAGTKPKKTQRSNYIVTFPRDRYSQNQCMNYPNLPYIYTCDASTVASWEGILNWKHTTLIY